MRVEVGIERPGECGVVRDGRAAEAGEVVDEARIGRRPPRGKVGALDRFNLEGSVVIGATDREGRERQLRYVARQRMASGRASELVDGRVASLLNVAGRSARTDQP